MLTLLIFLLVLSVLVFVHEFGHFITAKRAGLRVDEFGFGFPPRAVGIRKRSVILRSDSDEEPALSLSKGSRANARTHIAGRFFAALRMTGWEIIWGNPKDFDARSGNTLYSINWLPFGGFVRIKGESGEGAEDRDSFASRPALSRIWIVSAGVLMNALLAVVLIAAGLTVGFPQIVGEDLPRHAQVKDKRIEVLAVLKDGPAEKAGIVPGAYIRAGGGRKFDGVPDLQAFVAEFLEKPAHLEIEEEGVRREIELTPQVLEETGRPGIGVSIADTASVRYPFWLAVPKAVETTGVLAYAIVAAIGDIIRDAVVGRPVTADLAGPVGVAVLTGAAARQGFIYLLQFVAILSVNLAILNIIPFPALDGGRILFVLIEKLRGRPVARRIEGWIHAVGFVLLIMLVVAVTVRDVGKYGGRIVEFFKRLI